MFERIRRKITGTQGSLIMESCFVYPIMLFAIVFLVLMGNAFYIKANVQSIVSREALTYAEKYSDPNYVTFMNEVPTSNENYKVTSELYRYIDVLSLSDYGREISTEQKQKLISEIEKSNYFRGMTSNVTKIKTHQVHNYAIYHTYEVAVDYEIKFPFTFIFTNEPTILHMTAREEVPIVDTPEFIRNVDMAVDFMERTGTGQGIEDKLAKVYEKVEDFIDGKKRDPNEAVAGAGALETSYGKSSSNITEILDNRPELIGTNREKLLSTVQDNKLATYINEVYRPGASIGDGGTADALISEFYSGNSNHLLKVQERLKGINKIINSGNLGLNDLDIAEALRDDLEYAIGLFK